MKNMEKEIYFTPRQAATYFNLSLSTVKNYIYGGKLKTLKTPGGHHRIRKSELLATLGERIASKKDRRDFSLEASLCIAMLAVFKAFGSIGNSLTMHARSVSSLSHDIAKAMGMDASDIRRVEMAGLVHDIGHIGIDRHILLKSRLLRPEEYESVKKHPKIGKDLLDSVKELKGIADIVVQHHERMDGRGYPKALSGEEIQKGARIISVAEAYDSMSSAHSYKKPISKEKAIAELMQQRGSQFDGDVVDTFIKII